MQTLIAGVVRSASSTGSTEYRSPAPSLVRESAEGLDPWLRRLRDLARSRDPLLRTVLRFTVRKLDDDIGRRIGPLPPAMEGELPDALMDRVLFLQSVDLFEHQRVDELVAIAVSSQERAFAAGELIYQEEDPSDALYIIMHGEVELSLGGREVMTLGKGQSFGQLSMLDRKPRPVTARALTPLKVISLGRIEFFDLIADRSELLQGLVEVLVKRIRSLLEEVTDTDQSST